MLNSITDHAYGCNKQFRVWQGKTPFHGVATGFVYFIEAVADCVVAIKVGYSTRDPRKRIADMQTGNHNHLRVLACVPGNIEMEQDLHRRLSASGIRGEWFRPTEAVYRSMGLAVLVARFIETMDTQ